MTNPRIAGRSKRLGPATGGTAAATFCVVSNTQDVSCPNDTDTLYELDTFVHNTGGFTLAPDPDFAIILPSDGYYEAHGFAEWAGRGFGDTADTSWGYVQILADEQYAEWVYESFAAPNPNFTVAHHCHARPRYFHAGTKITMYVKLTASSGGGSTRVIGEWDGALTDLIMGSLTIEYLGA